MPPKPNNNNKCHIFFFHCELENKKHNGRIKVLNTGKTKWWWWNYSLRIIPGFKSSSRRFSIINFKIIFSPEWKFSPVWKIIEC